MPCLKRLLEDSEVPLLLDHCISDWDASNWTPAQLADGPLSSTNLMWRIGRRNTNDVQWERDCQYVQATLNQFNEYITVPASLKDTTSDNHLLKFAPSDEAWIYADYKHLPHILPPGNYEQLIGCVDWSRFGYPGRDASQSTLWIGTAGAYTPCHYDTYGCNLVAQIYGRKRWVLFPPSRLKDLKPTRVPLEESSVFSQLNLNDPQQIQHLGDRYEIVLKPGQVLFVPKHWWHYVENLETSISINTWIEMDSDDRDRQTECLNSLLASALVSQSGESLQSYLNPKEELSDLGESLQLLNKVLKAAKEGCNQTPPLKARSQTVENPESACPCLNCKGPTGTNSSPTVTKLEMVGTENQAQLAGVKRKQVDFSDEINLKTLINAVCHPKVLNEIRDILLNERH